MKELKLSTTIQVYSNQQELGPSESQLLQAAKEALNLAYAPYSTFKVGAGRSPSAPNMGLGTAYILVGRESR